jgi:YHS domain-containing protein
MPNYRSYLSDAQVDGIVAYLKTLARAHPATSSPRSLAIDPVCGMQVSAGPDTPNITYGGKTYYFCSETCREKFQTAPGKYIKP